MRALSRPFAVALCAALLSGCFRSHPTFKDWLYYSGDEWFIPKSERTKAYLGFRLPELVFQPAGGATYPVIAGGRRESSSTVTDYSIDGPGGSSWVRVTETRYGESEGYWGKRGVLEENFFYSAGALDLLPYRVWASGHYHIDEKIGWTFGHMGMFAIMYPIGVLFRAPYYAAHDVYKVVMMPVALLHYSE